MRRAPAPRCALRAATLALVVAAAGRAVAVEPAAASPPVEPSAVEAAKAAEERAFQAIDAERWCDAQRAFVEADALAPSPALVLNAAQAAELAGDRAGALALWADAVTRATGAERKKAKQGMDALKLVVDRDGPGAPCPPPPPVEVAAPPPPEPPAPPPPPPPPPTVEPPFDPAPFAWATAATGAVVVAAGGAAVIVGLVPVVTFTDAQQKILAAEQRRGDASAVQLQQSDARAAWEGWGRPAVIVGAVAAGLGIAIGAAGVVWALASSAPDEAGAP